MSKQIIYNPEARLKMMAGIDRVARAVIVTMGSNGPAVMIQHRTDGIMPIFTRDGVTVARSINFDDRITDLGGRMLRDVAGAVSRQVGDGTTTSIVLAQKLAQDCLKSVAAGFHPLQLKKGLDIGLALVEKNLAEKAFTEVSADWIEKISAVATNQAAIDVRTETLRQEAAIMLAKKPGQGSATGNKHDYEELEDRMAFLKGRTGVFSVGGMADFEIKERLVRIENAYMSAIAALEEGVLPGGGVALFHCIKALDSVIAENAEQQQGIRILQAALSAPLQKITQNAGFNSEEVIARLNAQDDDSFTLDTRHHLYGNFLEIGIIDPVKVMRLALRNAVSVVGTMMTTETVVMDVPDNSIMDGYSPEWAAATREDPRA
ncbi:MAG: TCP-1/cpn60 chaperonin family protein [Methylococcaceae bacterium]